MDSYQPFPFGWGYQGPTDNQQPSSPGQFPNTAMESSSTLFSYQNLLQVNAAYDLRPDDMTVKYGGVEGHPTLSVAEAQTDTRPSRRAKYGYLDWKAHKAAIRNLYMDQNKSLSETMEVMKNVHSFDASEKLYKDKFKEWGWQKNLPAKMALFMNEKAKQRKQEEGKDTIFSFGGRLWDRQRVENTLVRTKRPRGIENFPNFETPRGLSYKTPKPLLSSPPPDRDRETDDSHNDGFGNVSEGDLGDAGPLAGSTFALSWCGRSRSDLQEMWGTARLSRDAGKFDEAEDMFWQVFVGMSHVLGKTNKDTVGAAYNLADLYADSGRMGEALNVIEKVIQNHIDVWGCQDKMTQQNVLHAVELLNGWNRQADALGLLSLSEELLQSFSSAQNPRRANCHISKKEKSIQKSVSNGTRSDLSRIIQSVLDDPNPTKVDYGLGVACAHVAAKDQAAEGLLLAMVSQCEDRPDLAAQHLKARAELVRLYDKLGQTKQRKAEFECTLRSLTKVWDSYNWELDEIESFDLMEAALQLIANLLKCGYRTRPTRMFRNASDKAAVIFGSDDERTVWVLITIGLVYQTHMTWDDAEEWFEGAFSAALANKAWGPKDGIVRALQNAIDHRHFSYVSDKGRPFKTVFGVSGITIRPGRLHLE